MISAGWPQSHDDHLRECVSLDMSYREAAFSLNEKFGTSYTKNACCGRSFRIGLKSSLSAKDGNAKRLGPRKTRKKPSPSRKARPMLFNPASEQSVLRPDPVEPLHIEFLDLEKGHCRFPYGDNHPYTFCGRPVRPGSCYCNHHFALTTPSMVKPSIADREMRIRAFARANRSDAKVFPA